MSATSAGGGRHDEDGDRGRRFELLRQAGAEQAAAEAAETRSHDDEISSLIGRHCGERLGATAALDAHLLRAGKRAIVRLVLLGYVHEYEPQPKPGSERRR